MRKYRKVLKTVSVCAIVMNVFLFISAESLGCFVPRLHNGEIIQETPGDYYWNWRFLRYERNETTTKVPDGKTVPPAKTYILSCHNGYLFQGMQIRKTAITCNEGRWLPDPVCLRGGCSVPRLDNGDIIQETPGDYYWNWKIFRYERNVTTTKIPVGKRVRPATTYFLSCHNGYSLQGTQIRKSRITCNEGRWIPTPVCLRSGTIYVPSTTSNVLSTSVLLTTSAAPGSVTVKTTPIFENPTTTSRPHVEYSLEVKLDNGTSSAAHQSKVEDCSCEYPISDEHLVAYVNGKRLQFRDKVTDGALVVFTCKHVGFHGLRGPHENKCDNCGSWHTDIFPTCSELGGCKLNRDASPNLLIDPIQEFYRLGDIISIWCPPGQNPTSSEVNIMCLGSSWSHEIPNCVETM